MIILSEDILYTIILKLHRFNYLYNLTLTNKVLCFISQSIINNHCNNVLHKYLNLSTEENKSIYILISRYLYNYKIINKKKISNTLIPTLNTNSFVKQFILYSHYFDNLYSKNGVSIINLNSLNIFMEEDALYYPFIVIYLKVGYVAYIECSLNLFNTYRIKLRNNNDSISLYSDTTEAEILEIIGKSKLELFNKIYSKFSIYMFRNNLYID